MPSEVEGNFERVIHCASQAVVLAVEMSTYLAAHLAIVNGMHPSFVMARVCWADRVSVSNCVVSSLNGFGVTANVL